MRDNIQQSRFNPLQWFLQQCLTEQAENYSYNRDIANNHSVIIWRRSRQHFSFLHKHEFENKNPNSYKHVLKNPKKPFTGKLWINDKWYQLVFSPFPIACQFPKTKFAFYFRDQKEKKGSKRVKTLMRVTKKKMSFN